MNIKLIDKYIFKQFILTFIFGIVAFASLFVVINIIESMDNFIDKKVPFLIVVEYYIAFLPEIIKLITPISILLACLFVMGKLSSQSEIIALKAAGISYYRIIVPFLIGALMISSISVVFGGFLVPKSQKKLMYINRHHLKDYYEGSSDAIYFQDNKTRIVTISYFNINNLIASRVSIQDFNKDNLTIMQSRIDANQMQFDTASSSWILTNVLKRSFINDEEKLEKFDSLKLTDLNFKPLDVEKKQQKPAEMNLFELREYADEQIKSGNDPTRVLIEYHSRYAFAFASFIIVFFGLTISSNNRKSGVALQLGLNMAITFAYLILFKLSEAFGKNGVFDPVLTAWITNLIFLILGLINIRRVK